MSDIQIYYRQVLCVLDVQILVLVAWGRYIFMNKKTYQQYLLCKCGLWTFMSQRTYRHVKTL